MAIYHLAVQVIGRSAGRSATAAASYRAGIVIVDTRTGEVHDNTRKRGVLHSEIVLPGGGTMARSELWNKVEKYHKRGDAVLVRELVIGLPTELTMAVRQTLAVGFASELSNRYGVAADVALHSPCTITDRDLEKDPSQYFEIDSNGWRNNANWHSHIMLSACHVSVDGTLGKKAVELDPIHCQRAKIKNMVDWARARWAELVNAALEQAGESARVDHRSHKVRGLTEIPGHHHGPAVSGILSRGEHSEVAERQESERATLQRAQLEAQLTIARAQSATAQSELQRLEAEEALAVARLARGR